MLEEFKKFALRGNVVDLAVGVIIGAAFSGIVNSLVGDVIMPVIGAITGGIDFSNYYTPLSSKVTAGALVEAKKQGAVLAWGNFLTVTLNFIIIAFVLFLAIRALNRLARKEEEKAPEPSKTEQLLTEIRDQLKKEGKGHPSGIDAEAYVIPWSLNRFAWKAGAGIDLRLNRAVALRLGSFDYTMTRTILQDGHAYGNALQVSTGLILRMGTW